jgi:hypothetical protein
MYTDKHINSFSHKVCTISYEQFLIGIKLGLRDPVYEQTQKNSFQTAREETFLFAKAVLITCSFSGRPHDRQNINKIGCRSGLTVVRVQSYEEQYFFPWKNAVKKLGSFGGFSNKISQSKQLPNSRKFAKPSHPDAKLQFRRIFCTHVCDIEPAVPFHVFKNFDSGCF